MDNSGKVKSLVMVKTALNGIELSRGEQIYHFSQEKDIFAIVIG